jgi:hypothetical protein
MACLHQPYTKAMRWHRLPFSPELVHARWALGKLPSEEAPSLAQDALEFGHDGKNVRRIAGLTRPNQADLLPFMPGFFAEMGVSAPLSREQAAWLLARLIAKGISERQVTPYEGARFIAYEIVCEVWPNQQHPLLSFVGLASDYEDCESYSQHPDKRRREIDEEIVEEARTVLASLE